MARPCAYGSAIRHNLSVAAFATFILVGAAGASKAYCQDSPALFVLRGDFYQYGFFGRGATVQSFGPVEDSFSTTFEFPDGGATDRSIFSTIGLTGMDGTLSVSLMNEALLTAREDAGNDHGGGFDAIADIYVLGAPGTAYFIQRSLSGSATAVRGGGPGTTHAHLSGTTAVINNGSGAQTLPVTITSRREFAGMTSSAPHPTQPGYHLAGSVAVPAWGFTFQSIAICFPIPCPDPLNFRSTSILAGSVTAGPCCPKTPELDDWNYPTTPITTQTANNCYDYATNRQTGGYTQPGGLPVPADYTCMDVANGATVDGFDPMAVGDPNGCGMGECVVALVVAPAAQNGGLTDFHWYRRNCDGTWSHKPGKSRAKTTDSSGNVITDPRTADRSWKLPRGTALPGYSIFCGFYCVPCDFELGPTPQPSPMHHRQSSLPNVVASMNFGAGRPDRKWSIENPQEISAIQEMVFSGSPTDPIVDRDELGYSGVTLTSSTVPGFPDFVRVLDGVVEIIDGDNAEYRSDAAGLEDHLLDLAPAVGVGASPAFDSHNQAPGSGVPVLTQELPSLGPSELVVSLSFLAGAVSPEWSIEDPQEISAIQQMVFSGSPTDPIVDRDELGYSGMALTPTTVPGFPDFVRVLDGVVEIIDGGNAEYRSDAAGLEDHLLDLAVAEGFGDYVDGSTSISNDPSAAPGVPLLAVAPNPFQTTTVVTFSVSAGDRATVRAYDANGRLVATLFEGAASGISQSVEWGAAEVPAGTYFVKVETDSHVATEKVLLLK